MAMNRIFALASAVLLASCSGDSTQKIAGANDVGQSEATIHHLGGVHKSLTRVQPSPTVRDESGRRRERDAALQTFRSVLGTPAQAQLSPIVSGGTGALRGIVASNFQELVAMNQRLPVTAVEVDSEDSAGRQLAIREYRVRNRTVFRIATSSRLTGSHANAARDSSEMVGLAVDHQQRFLRASNLSQHYDTLPYYFLEVEPQDPYWQTDATSEERAAFAAGFAAMQADLDAQIADIQLEDPQFFLSSATARERGVGPCVSLVSLASYSIERSTTCNPTATRAVAVSGVLLAISAVGGAAIATVAPEPFSKLALSFIWTGAAGAVVGAAAAIIMHRDCMNEQSHASLNNPFRARFVRGDSFRVVPYHRARTLVSQL
jgi:hypothetical protein